MKSLRLIFIVLIGISCQLDSSNSNHLLLEEIDFLNRLIVKKIEKLRDIQNSDSSFNNKYCYLNAVVTKQMADTLVKKLSYDTTRIENMENELLDFYFSVQPDFDEATNTDREVGLSLDMTDLDKYNHMRKILFQTYVSIELLTDSLMLEINEMKEKTPHNNGEHP